MHKTTALVAQLEAAARRWWVPSWLGDLLIRAAAHIEVQAEMEKLMQMKLDIARGEAND
jgi:hypothetical protein